MRKVPAQPAHARNFCPDCGKRNAAELIHTCTPPAAERQPLTQPEIEQMLNNMPAYDGDYETAIVRITETAHNIRADS